MKTVLYNIITTYRLNLLQDGIIMQFIRRISL